jgi:hypothetical protein
MLRIVEKTTGAAGVNRRELLRAGGLSLFGGLSLENYLRAAALGGAVRKSQIKSVVLYNLLGGPSHMDMFDLKPEAPAEIRGEFKPITTSVPGLFISEHLPNTSRLMHRACLIRTISHTYDSHDPLPIMTGFTGGNAQLQAQPTDPPDIGAICQYLNIGPSDVPGAVCLPCYPGWGENGYRRGGPYGGFLGSRYDPLFAQCNPTFEREPKQNYYDPVMPIGEPILTGLDRDGLVTNIRFDSRRSLLEKLDENVARAAQNVPYDRLNHYQQKAFDLISARKTRAAFDLSQEADSVRDRYGRNLYGSSMLIARRLVEAGVPFISVHQEIFRHYGHSYDMHANNFGMLRDFNLPILDKIYPALIEDLDARGLLDSTLVIVMGEMGRSPRVNGAGGRDHWPRCGFSLLTGGGIRQGFTHGATDKTAAFPTIDPVHPSDLVATIYHLLGIDPNMIIHDRLGRPLTISSGGSVVHQILS